MYNLSSKVNYDILETLSTLAKKTVDYYLDRDDGNILTPLKSASDLEELSITVDNFLANEISKKFKLV